VAQEERVLRAAGASDAEIAALREARFGPEAARRLAALDVQRARFWERLAGYRAQRDERVAATADPVAAGEIARELREEWFEPDERLRVERLDELEARGLEFDRDPGRAAPIGQGPPDGPASRGATP
jgi:lipase chaperone LimK